MGNNDPHIDDFLSLNLDRLEKLPDEGAFSRMTNELENIQPMDYALHLHLNEVSLFPDLSSEPRLFDAISGNEHMIDAILFRKLENFEDLPMEQWLTISTQINSSGNRKWAFLLLLITLSAIGAFYLINKFGRDNHNAYTISQQGVPTSPEGNFQGNTSESDAPTDNEMNTTQRKKMTMAKDKSDKKNILENSGGLKKGISKDHNLNNSTSGRSKEFNSAKRFSKEYPGFEAQNSNTTLLTYLGSIDLSGESDQLRANKLLKIKSGSRPDQVSEISGSETKARSYFKKKLSPFFIGGNFGYINEHTINNEISSKNVHKDAVAVFGQATGKNRKGYHFGLYAGYRLSGNFSIKIGFTYMKTVVSNNLNYTYTDVPIKDSATGKILTYYKRSVRNSPQVESENTNENISFYMPVVFSAKFLERNKFSAWGELGANILLKNKFSTRLFSFDDGALTNLNVVKLQRVTPNVAIILQYRFLPDIHFTAGIHLGYQRRTFYIDDYSYLKTEFIPGFNIGFIYNPLIRQ